ncbi:MAG: ribosome recycling factor [Taibaiella sp.]|nr:ribosome recycling factor [Taibaiella sp.]
MEGTVSEILNSTSEKMKKAIQHLDNELQKVRAGKASPSLVDGITVDYYGAATPLNQVANVMATDVRTISIQPWEKTMIGPIEKAILMANIGITPQNDGELIRLFLPPLTEERRKELVKKVNAEGENAKVIVRNIRRDGIEAIKKLQKEGLSEDEAKGNENKIQGMTDNSITSIDHVLKEKEKEIMTI